MRVGPCLRGLQLHSPAMSTLKGKSQAERGHQQSPVAILQDLLETSGRNRQESGCGRRERITRRLPKVDHGEMSNPAQEYELSVGGNMSQRALPDLCRSVRTESCLYGRRCLHAPRRTTR